MYTGPSVFSQLIDSLSRYAFQNCVLQYNGDHYVKSFPCWQQFLCLCFGQLTFRESLRSIVLCLNAHPTKLYHLGLRGAITKSTLAEANEQLLNDIDGTFYALDSTTIDLCLSVFHWAHFRETKGAVKLHTLLDLRGNIPVFVHISDGTVHDVNILDTLPIESGAYYVMDRGYIDYRRLYAIHQANAFFIIRAKQNLCFVRLYSHPTNRHTGILCDQIIRFHSDAAQEKYPEKLRRVKYRDATTKNTYVYLTNNMTISALQIADIYKHRWGIEQFFKWIKGHLKSGSFGERH